MLQGPRRYLFMRIWDSKGEHEKVQFTVLPSDPPARCLHTVAASCSAGLEVPERTNAFSKDTVVTQLNKKLGHMAT